MPITKLIFSTATLIAFASLTSIGCQRPNTAEPETDPQAELDALMGAGSLAVQGTISPVNAQAGDEVTIIFEVATPRATVLSVEATVFDPMDQVAYHVSLGGRQVSPSEALYFEDYFVVEPNDPLGNYRLAVNVIHTGTGTLLISEPSVATFTVESGLPFQVIAGLTLSTTTPEPGDTLNGMVTYQNVSSAPIAVGRIIIATRPPGGTHGGGPYLDMTPILSNLTVQPQGTVQLSASRTLATDAPAGTWEAYPTYRDDAGVWHDGPSVFFTVACQPTTCAAQSATCGEIDDGCGNILSCGSCTSPASCGGGGVPNTCGTSSACNPTLPGPTTSPFFINMEADCYWCEQPVFVDLVKAAECFRNDWSYCVNGQSTFATDSNGWPLAIPSTGVARSVLGPVYRTGIYNVRWKGKGTFAVRSYDGVLAAPLVVQSTGDGMATVEAVNQGAIVIEITATDPTDNLRDMSVIHEALEPTADCEPFYPEIISYLQGFAGLRMMDWTLTNDSPQVEWSDHIPAYSYREANRFETAIELCNRIQRDCWLNVPHQANDDYVLQLANLVHNELDPGLRVWIEYSNETWNFIFDQADYCVDQGVAEGLATDPYEAGFRYHAFRAKQIFNIFYGVFGASASTRVVRVVAGQSAGTWILGKHIDELGSSTELDVYATAPYFGGDSIDGFDGQADNWNLTQLFAHLNSDQLPEAVNRMNATAAALAAYNPPIPFVAYEGGQHLAGNSASPAARTLFEQAQSDDRMYDLHLLYFDAWRQAGGRTFAYFTSLKPINGRTGSWGLKPSLDTPDAQAPKYRALKAWEAANPRWW
jgi:hypothetical protein